MVQRNDRNRRRGGFTLVEVLLVLVILVIIASIAAMNIGPMQRRGQIDAAKTQIRTLMGPLDAFRLHMGDYPQSLDDLMRPPGDANSAQEWSGPYLNHELPMDPWRHPYRYQYPGRHGDSSTPDIWSMGPDGIDGNQDDINSWNNG